MVVLIIDCHIGLFGTGFMQVLYFGRAPRTKENLPDFLKKCLVARHSRVFRGFTGSQWTPGFWGVTKEFFTVVEHRLSLYLTSLTVAIGLLTIESFIQYS